MSTTRVSELEGTSQSISQVSVGTGKKLKIGADSAIDFSILMMHFSYLQELQQRPDLLLLVFGDLIPVIMNLKYIMDLVGMIFPKQQQVVVVEVPTILTAQELVQLIMH